MQIIAELLKSALQRNQELIFTSFPKRHTDCHRKDVCFCSPDSLEGTQGFPGSTIQCWLDLKEKKINHQ